MDFEKNAPSMDAWLSEAKEQVHARKIGMYLVHNGVVRASAKAQARGGERNLPPVTGMLFSYDSEKVSRVLEDSRNLEGVSYVRIWLNEGTLCTGDDLMYVLVGGDIRPHVMDGLQYIVDRLKKECVSEQELYE